MDCLQFACIILFNKEKGERQTRKNRNNTEDPVHYGWDLAEWLERLTANAEVAAVLASIPASSDTVESEGRQMKQCWIQFIEK